MQKYVFHFCFTVAIFFLPIVLFSWWAEPIYGDLTRIGKWTEYHFGPNETPPSIQVKPNGQSQTNADVLVLGDSFSEKNLWQSVVAQRTGHKVKSFNYKENCISNWLTSSILDPLSNIIVIETVERALVSRFGNIALCTPKELAPIEIKGETERNSRPVWPLTLDIFYLTTSAYNTVISWIKNETYSKRFKTVNASLIKNCALFSHQQQDRLLYYFEDDQKEKWNQIEIKTTVNNILNIQKQVEQSGKEFVFVIAPDKSTAYKSCLKNGNSNLNMPDMNKILISSGVNAPNMHDKFQEHINVIIDLYDPDNTHWSRAGYILAGETIGRYITSNTSIR